MCISVFTSSHPDYPFILISNRDEPVSRPTLRANWWDPPNQHVLGGRDSQRDERGTWLGITKQGRIVLLTNFREEGDSNINREKSRGAIANSYLCLPPDSPVTEEEHAQRLITDVGFHDVGGFTMVFGKLRKPNADRPPTNQGMTNANHTGAQTMPGLAVISNRTENPEQPRRIATTTNETHGVSNSHYGDRSWPKVVNGEQYLSEAIQNHISQTPSPPEQTLIDSLFSILCSDTLPRRQSSESWEMYTRHLRKSILIPPAKCNAPRHNPADDLRAVDEKLDRDGAEMQVGRGAYGTSKQTVILVNRQGKVTFIERSLFDEEGLPVPHDRRDVRFEFEIEGWSDAD